MPTYTIKEVSTTSHKLSDVMLYCLVLKPAYTVKEVSTASVMIILFSAYACLYCQRSLNCFYNAYKKCQRSLKSRFILFLLFLQLGKNNKILTSCWPAAGSR